LQKKEEEDRYRVMRQVGMLTTIPILLAVSPLIGYFIGRFIDVKLGTAPYLSIVFLIVGFIGGGMQVARVIKQADRKPSKKG
jgi:F0F1-type ATP synthase assembly protein I